MNRKKISIKKDFYDRIKSYARLEGIPITYALDKAFKEGALYREGVLKTFLIGVFEGEEEILSAVKMLSSEEIKEAIIMKAKRKIADKRY